MIALEQAEQNPENLRLTQAAAALDSRLDMVLRSRSPTLS